MATDTKQYPSMVLIISLSFLFLAEDFIVEVGPF